MPTSSRCAARSTSRSPENQGDTNMRTIMLSAAIGLLVAGAAVAADCRIAPACCDPGACTKAQDCCRICQCKKVCKVVCEMKQVKKHVWVVECEEFCAPLPGLGRGCAPCGDTYCEPACCEDGCGGQSCSNPCASLCRPMVPPKCGRVRCRKKLVKKEVVCEVPAYKCVVVCCGCGCCEGGCQEARGCHGETDASPEPPTPAETAGVAPLPPVVGTSYLKSLEIRP